MHRETELETQLKFYTAYLALLRTGIDEMGNKLTRVEQRDHIHHTEAQIKLIEHKLHVLRKYKQ